MNLRLPALAGVIAIAAGAAAFRAAHRPAETAPFASETQAPSPGHARHPREARALPERIVIYVAGEVQHSGIYKLAPSARAIDAVRAAGGTTANADLVAVNLAQSLADGDEVAVPAIGARAPATHRRGSHRAKGAHRKAKSTHRHQRRRRVETADGDPSNGDDAAEPTSVVDLNTADENELETLPGVGATLAERIVAFRELTGPFASTDDLLDVSGITQAKLDAIAPYVRAETRESAP